MQDAHSTRCRHGRRSVTAGSSEQTMQRCGASVASQKASIRSLMDARDATTTERCRRRIGVPSACSVWVSPRNAFNFCFVRFVSWALLSSLSLQTNIADTCQGTGANIRAHALWNCCTFAAVVSPAPFTSTTIVDLSSTVVSRQRQSAPVHLSNLMMTTTVPPLRTTLHASTSPGRIVPLAHPPEAPATGASTTKSKPRVPSLSSSSCPGLRLRCAPSNAQRDARATSTCGGAASVVSAGGGTAAVWRAGSACSGCSNVRRRFRGGGAAGESLSKQRGSVWARRSVTPIVRGCGGTLRAG